MSRDELNQYIRYFGILLIAMFLIFMFGLVCPALISAKSTIAVAFGIAFMLMTLPTAFFSWKVLERLTNGDKE